MCPRVLEAGASDCFAFLLRKLLIDYNLSWLIDWLFNQLFQLLYFSCVSNIHAADSCTALKLILTHCYNEVIASTKESRKHYAKIGCLKIWLSHRLESQNF